MKFGMYGVCVNYVIIIILGSHKTIDDISLVGVRV